MVSYFVLFYFFCFRIFCFYIFVAVSDIVRDVVVRRYSPSLAANNFCESFVGYMYE